MGLIGRLRWAPRSVLPVRLSACDIVSMFRSPVEARFCSVDVGLPSGLRPGDMLRPFTDPDLLFGGDVSGPCEDMGDLIGDGDRLAFIDVNEVRPARCIDSRLPAGPAPGPCSACTTSANEMKLNRRTSLVSSAP